MRTAVALSVTLLIGLMRGIAARAADRPEIVVRVTSSTPGVETSFSAAWLVRGGDSPLVTAAAPKRRKAVSG